MLQASLESTFQSLRSAMGHYTVKGLLPDWDLKNARFRGVDRNLMRR